jgi:hypothetical protein
VIAGFQIDLPKAHKRQKGDLRNRPRIKNNIKVTLDLGNRLIEGFTNDLSMTGLMVKCREHLEEGKNLPISLQHSRQIFNMQQDFLDLTAVVRRQKKNGNDYLWNAVCEHE